MDKEGAESPDLHRLNPLTFVYDSMCLNKRRDSISPMPSKPIGWRVELSPESGHEKEITLMPLTAAIAGAKKV